MSSSKSNRPIMCWVHPRSLSTCFERLMLERGDLKILHEPFGYLFYVHEARVEVPFFYVDPDHPTSYADIKKMILSTDAASEGKTRTFVKDMSFHCLEHILKDDEFIRSVDHTFLIRDPVKAIASHFTINPSVTMHEIGFDSQALLFKKVVEVTGKVPAVIDADEFQRDTEGVVAGYCQHLGLGFDESCLSWKPGMVKEWNAWAEWHAEAARTSSIAPPSTNEKHMKIIQEHSHLQEYLEYHTPFYQEMVVHKLTREKASALLLSSS